MLKLKAIFSTLAAVSLCALVLGLSGCGSAATADRAAKDSLAEVDRERAQDSSLENLDRVQATLDSLASNSNLSDVMQILVRSRQAQVRLERIQLMIGDLRSQELTITRNINDMENLAMQVASAQANAEALKAYEPTGQVEKLKAQEAQIGGSESQPTWQMAGGSGTLPTLFAIKAQIQSLTQQIADNQSQTDAAHKLSAAKGDEAEQYLRRAEGELGDNQVADTVSAATDRRDAALADSQAAGLANDLTRLHASLDEAKVQEAALESAVSSLEAQIQAQNDRWTSISQQIDAERKVQSDLILPTGEPGSVSIDLLATSLAVSLQEAAKMRDTVNDQLNAVIPQLNTIITHCNALRTTWRQDEMEKQDSPDVAIWHETEEILHPMYFNLQMATALEARASVAAAKTRIDLMIERMFDGYTGAAAAGNQGVVVPGLTALLDKNKTGIDVPKALGDLQPLDPDALKQEEDDANKAFSEAADAYGEQRFGATDTGAPAAERRNVALLGTAQLNRQWADFASFIGDASGAAEHEHAAEDAQTQIDPTFSLAATVLPPAAPASTGGTSSSGGNANP
jgi:hypothetical protein